MILIDILADGLLAAIAAIGFGAISDPPLRAFPYIALLAAIGHAFRFCLMTLLGVDIATASLFASFSIGMGSLLLGKRIYCPMTVLYIPALLPMIPGIHQYHRDMQRHLHAGRRCYHASVPVYQPCLLHDAPRKEGSASGPIRQTD